LVGLVGWVGWLVGWLVGWMDGWWVGFDWLRLKRLVESNDAHSIRTD